MFFNSLLDIENTGTSFAMPATSVITAGSLIRDSLLREHDMRAAIKVFIDITGWSTKRARGFLANGNIDPWILVEAYPRLQSRLKIQPKLLLNKIIDSICPHRHRLLSRMILERMATEGMRPDDLERRTGISSDAVRAVALGRSPSQPTRQQLAHWLKMPDSKLKDMVYQSELKRMVPTEDLENIPDLEPISHIILSACVREGVSPTIWSHKHRLREATIRELVQGELPHLESQTIARIGELVGKSLKETTASLRLNVPVPKGQIPGLKKIVSDYIDKQQLSLEAVAIAAKVPIRSIQNLFRHGDFANSHPLTRWKILRYFGISHRQFSMIVKGNNQTVRSTAASVAVTDDVELNVLRVMRRETPEVRRRMFTVLICMAQLPAERQQELADQVSNGIL